MTMPFFNSCKIKRIDFYFSNSNKNNPITFDETIVENSQELCKYKTENIDEIKEKIKLLKIKEPVKKSSWVDYTDTLYEKKELMNILKLKEPVKNSSWIDFY